MTKVETAATAAPQHFHTDKLDHPREAKLTPGRRQILDLLMAEGRSLGAYDIIDRVATVTGKRLAPITVYRALDFLLESGLVHRLASRNAFLACGHPHDAAEPVIFLICDCCGAVREATSEAIDKSLADVVATAGFTLRARVIELVGRCAVCTGPAAT